MGKKLRYKRFNTMKEVTNYIDNYSIKKENIIKIDLMADEIWCLLYWE